MSSKIFYKCSIYLFNLSNILCLKNDANENLKLSKLLSWKNFLFVPLTLFVRFLIPSSVVKVGFNAEAYVPTGLSFFFYYSFVMMMVINVFLLASCIFIQWWNREKNLKLILQCVNIYQNYKLFNEQSFKSAEKKLFFRAFAFLTLIVVLICFEYSGIAYLNWEGLLLYLLYPNNGLIGLMLLGFFNCFLSYFEFLLEFLSVELEKQKLRIYKMFIYDNIVNFTVDLHSLICEFEKTLGTLLTLVVVIIVITSTIRVNFYRNLNKKDFILLNIFQLYAIAVSLQGLIYLPWKTLVTNLIICFAFVFCTIQLVIAPCQQLSTNVN